MLISLIALSACGSENDSAVDGPAASAPEVAPEAAATTPAVTAVEGEAAPLEDDHAEGQEENHGDENHGDEDDDDHVDDVDDVDEHEDHGDEGGEGSEDHVGDDQDHDDHDGASGGLGAHEHGAAELSVAWIDAEVSIDLISPTFNVFGFEYEPTSDEDLAIEADRTEALTAAGIITVNDEAGCTLVDPVETEVEREGSHSEISVSWLYSCANPDAIESVDASGLFEEFPNLEDVDAQWVSDADQSSAELSPSSTTLTLRR